MSSRESVTQGRSDRPPTAQEPPDIVGTGTSGDGLASVTIGTDGFVDSVKFDPRLKRLDTQDMAERVLAAILAAQHDWRNQSSAAPDPDAAAKNEALEQKMAEIRAEYERNMARIIGTREELIRHLKNGRR